MADSAIPVTDSAADVDLSGRQLGDYQLLRRLGRGGMADVYLAEQISLRRQVAFKVLKSDLAHDASYVKRFHLEAQAAAALVHANIVQIHEVGNTGGVHFIAQEYVPGMNLREWMSRNGLPDAAATMVVLRQVAAALAKAAEHGIVHRDIKPENILLSQTNEVKVADFGLARVAGDGAGVNLTQIGITMGTPLYMSPEQVEGKSLDPRSDIYSLGVTCYHLLTGQPPFRGETALGIAVQHLNNQPAPLSGARPDLPSGLSRVVHKMLAKDPAQRYASAKDLLRDLRTLAAPGGADHWPVDLDLHVDGGPITSAFGNDATARLDSLMKTEALVLPNRRWLRWLAACAAGAFVVGGGLAYINREPYLLATVTAADGKSPVTRKANAESQFIYAVWANTEDAWKSVFEYFPDDQVYAARAKQELARLYLQRDDYPSALALFNELAAMDKVESQYRAFGLAGKFVVYTLQEKNAEAADALLELRPVRDRLDVQMRATVARMLRNQRQAIGDRQSRDWETWMSSLPAETATPTDPVDSDGLPR